jgi:hypothetical protein
MIAPDGERVILAAADRVIGLGRDTGSVEWEHIPPRSLGFLVVSPTSIAGDADRVFAAFDNGTIIEWSYAGHLRRLWNVPECPRLIAMGEDLLFGCDGHYLNAWRVGPSNAAKPRREVRARMPDRTFALSSAPRSGRIATRSLHSVHVWEVSSEASALKLVGHFHVGTGLPLVALHPSGAAVAYGDGNGVRIGNPHGLPLAELDLGAARPVSLAWYPDGRTLAIGTSTGAIRLLSFGEVAV